MSEVSILMIVVLTGATFVLSFAGCWLMRAISPLLGYVDRPGGRKSHTRVMPMGGGVAIIASMLLLIVGGMAAALAGVHTKLPAFDWLSVHLPGLASRTHQMGGILLCAVVLHVMGLIDDVKDLGPEVKLIVQVVAAGLVVMVFGVRVHLFIPVPILGTLITVLWIVVLTNAFNFLDNADGLSAGVALICTAVLLAVEVGAGQVFVSAFLACLAGALLGFLLHNFPPARIYLGDAGSMPVGFLLAVGSILTTYYKTQGVDEARIGVLIPLVVMAIPLYDFLSVIVLRWLSGQSPFVGDHRHFSHRLIKRGLSVRHAVLTIYLACGGTAVAAIVLRQVSLPYALLLFVQTICIVAIIALLEYEPRNKRSKK